MDQLNNLINNCLKLPIINVLIVNKYPIKGYFPRLSTIARWRNGKKYNVSIYLETNTFYDFVSGDFGNLIDLHCLITGDSKDNINYKSFYDLYSNVDLKGNITQQIKECELDNTPEETLEEIKNIYLNSKQIFKDHYFCNKKIFKINNNILQIKISNFILKNYEKKHIKLNKFDLYFLKLQNSLVIPMYNIETLEIQSLQYLLENKTKLFHFGGKLKKSFYPINFNIKNKNELNNFDTFILCEGVATGFSICDILNKNNVTHVGIISCFTSKNIENVCDFLLKSNKKIIISTDYDQINIISNKIILGAGLESLKKYKNNPNVICTIANMLNNNSKYYLQDIYSNFLIENKDYNNNITDFNDIVFNYSITDSSNVFFLNLNYYCYIFNKFNFLEQKKINNIITNNNSPFSYKYLNEFNELNDIIIENNFIFY